LVEITNVFLYQSGGSIIRGSDSRLDSEPSKFAQHDLGEDANQSARQKEASPEKQERCEGLIE
jgi:hypothetical protein